MCDDLSAPVSVNYDQENADDAMRLLVSCLHTNNDDLQGRACRALRELITDDDDYEHIVSSREPCDTVKLANNNR